VAFGDEANAGGASSETAHGPPGDKKTTWMSEVPIANG